MIENNELKIRAKELGYTKTEEKEFKEKINEFKENIKNHKKIE